MRIDKIVDVCLYNGEQEIFDIRYNILKEYVDEFVVVEFDTTFSGNKKESHPINLPKVSYHFFTQIIENDTDLPEAFAREYNQREMIKTCLTHLKDDDVVLMGDCDEIPDLSKVFNLNQKMKMRVYSYYLNNRSSEEFALGTVCLTYERLKSRSLNSLRAGLPLTDDYCGWHFTNMGDVDFLKNKIESYGHQEYNNDAIKDRLSWLVQSNQDYVGRNFTFTTDETDLPHYLIENKDKYEHLFSNRNV